MKLLIVYYTGWNSLTTFTWRAKREKCVNIQIIIIHCEEKESILIVVNYDNYRFHWCWSCHWCSWTCGLPIPLSCTLISALVVLESVVGSPNDILMFTFQSVNVGHV